MVRKPLRIVVDTNVLVSGIVFGGIPSQILQSILLEQIQAVSSRVLLAELAEVLTKKIKYTAKRIEQVIDQLGGLVEIVQPGKIIKVCRDPEDNRVLEAAVAGDCGYVVTGDKDLLVLKKYKSVRILTPVELVDQLELVGD